MISNPYIFIIYYLSIPISLIGFGSFFFSINKNFKISSNYGYVGLTGILIICIYSYLSSFFIKHSDIHNIIILILGIISFFYFNYKNNHQNRILVFFLVVYFIGFLIFKTHDDFPYYHFKYTYYLTQMPSVIGIGNFNLGLRTPSSIFYLNSLYYLPFIKYFMFQMAAFSIFLFSNIILINKIIKNNVEKNFDFLTYYYLLSFIFINIFFYRISEHGTDRSAQILILILIGEILFFVNFKSNIEKILSKLFLLIAIIISLKAFYVLYVIFFSIIIYKLYKSYMFKEIFLCLFSNFYLYFLLVLFSLILLVNFINSGCLVYPVSFTCFDSFDWAISTSEVKELNNWYEQWSKAGATPNYRVEDPDIYIKNLNWVPNWINEYFFTKVSDFILGLIMLCSLMLLTFFPYNKIDKDKNDRKINFVLLIIIILFTEWFYNHPTLRYGGYCLIAALFFIITATKLEKNKFNFEKSKKRIVFFIVLSLIIFLTRNIDRILKEHKQYAYNPLINVYYKVEDSYFELDAKLRKKKNNYNLCILNQADCREDEIYGIKKILNIYVFYKK